jgi:hypothetical protein
MPEIVLVCSVHAENGRCNANELFQILEAYSPEVLFQEIPYFDYLRKRENALQDPARSFSIPVRPLPLEILAITQYLNGRQLHQVPVDPLGQSVTHQRQHDEVGDWVLHSGPALRNFCDRLQHDEGEHGFPYLNSRQHNRALNKLDDIFLNALHTRPNSYLSKHYSSWKEYNARREESMVKNIIEFSENNTFDKAVFLFGAAHRPGLIREIRKIKRQLSVHIEWKLYH